MMKVRLQAVEDPLVQDRTERMNRSHRKSMPNGRTRTGKLIMTGGIGQKEHLCLAEEGLDIRL